LSSYALKWLAFLVQYPAIIPGTILVLRSPPRCGKNIITDFIRKSLFGPELVYSMSDLGKILGKFNSSIQGRKLIIMNEAGMLSGEWHKSNDHLKSLITEDYVSIERKGLENQECGHFPGFIVLSNHDAPIRVEQGDGRIVCLDVSPRCKGNFKYFGQLGKILNHPDTPGSFMSYLLDQDLSNWNPQENIPTTKMKTETMREHLPNPIRFIIDHISVWSKDQIEKPGCVMLYQEYRTWCEANGEKPFSNNNFGKKIPQVNIERKRAGGGKREWQYILDRSKIVSKLHESIGDIEEFELETHGLSTSDISQDSFPTKSSMEIPVFSVPETKKEEIEPEKEILKKIESVPSTSKNSEIIDIPEPVSDESEISSNLPENDKSESNSEETISKPVALPSDYPTRDQREKRLRQWAIDHGEDPDVFMTITEKDINLSREYRDRIMADADMIQFTKDIDDDPNSLMDMTRRERLISEEIMIRLHEDKGNPQPRSYNDDEWIEKISILQENGYLW
ncbi:1583_t:CDS:1, partial [Entrophospora sp. SA101]